METNKYTFFWKNESPFSNFYKCQFRIENILFFSSEQYFMYKKAMAFMDAETAELILKTKLPWEAKKLGRQVKNFKKEEWDEMCEKIMYDAVYHKFSQNKELTRKLLDTGETEICESSPIDLVWGCGLSMEDPKILNKDNWTGKNLLGKVLVNLRKNLRQQIEI
jgi:ribA/ribD-fused uncharacterized protein